MVMVGIYLGVVSGLMNKLVMPFKDTGFLKWFHELSDVFLAIQDCYRKEWNKLKRRYEDAIME